MDSKITYHFVYRNVVIDATRYVTGLQTFKTFWKTFQCFHTQFESLVIVILLYYEVLVEPFVCLSFLHH